MSTLMPHKRTFFEKARKTIMKNIVKHLYFRVVVRSAMPFFCDKDDQESLFSVGIILK